MVDRISEIPYNYTSFSDREIIIRLMGEYSWNLVNELRTRRRTGRSARMLFEFLGDIWVIKRNPFIQDDLLENEKRKRMLLDALQHRLQLIDKRANGDEKTLLLVKEARRVLKEFKDWLNNIGETRKQIGKHL